MRFLVLGAGAIGGYFGGKLQKGGADVTFLVRPKRAAQLADKGLVLKAQDGEIRVPAKTLLAGQIDGPYDVVLLCCKAYDLDDALSSIAPAVGPGSAVLPFLNGIKHLSILSDRFGPDQVLGGVTAVNAVLAANGDVVQSPVKIDMTAFGEPSGQRSARCAAIHQAFTAGGIAATLSDDITAFMWAKLFAFACIATVATLTRARAGVVAASPAGASFVSAVIEECGRVVAAEGYPPPADIAEIVRGLYAQRQSNYGPSMLVDMEEGRPTEGGHTIGDLVERAARRGVAAPILTAALCNLQAYEQGRGERAVAVTAASIVITNHDHGRFIAQAIDSALAQTHAAVEVVVVDDGSTDDSRRIIEDYRDAVRVLFREHGGQARAMLDGFRRSCGEVVLFLDGDDILYPDAVSRISARFGPRIAKVQGRLDLIDDRGHGLGRQTPPLAMPSGDLLPVVLMHGWYPAPPTSGNAFARATLEALLPVPESYARLSAADGRLSVSDHYGAIRLNLAGREPRGRVRKDEAESVFDELERELRSLTNLDTGGPAVTRVVKASDHYERRPMDNLPDLFVEWSGDRPVVRVRTARGDVVEGFYPDYRTGDHREQGAFWITGPGIAARALTSPVSITDFAPTIGGLLGVPLPGLDGRPIPGVAGSRSVASGRSRESA